MKFRRALREIAWILLSEGALSYRRMAHEFELSQDELAALKHEFIEVKGWARDQDGSFLVWQGAAAPIPAAVLEPSTPVESAPSGGERRQLTVMFADLVGSTELSTQLDPEDLQDVIRAYQEKVAEIVKQYDGYVAKYMGDGVLVYFGYPQAQERDAERAVLSGLAIIEAMSDLSAKVDETTDCPVLDVSSTGFAVTMKTVYEIGAIVSVVFDFEGEQLPGTASVQSIRPLRQGQIRYGMNCKPDAAGDCLKESLHRICMAIQRERLRRLAGLT